MLKIEKGKEMAVRDISQSASSTTYRRSLLDVLRGRRARNTVWISIYTVIVIMGMLFVITPILWMLSTSLKSMGEVFLVPPGNTPSWRGSHGCSST